MTPLKSKVTIGILVLSLLMGAGAFWQHTRYVSLEKQYKTLVDANKSLAEASKKDKAADRAVDGVTTRVIEQIKISQQGVEKNKADVLNAIEEGTPDEKEIMGTPIPDDLRRVLNNAYSRTGTGKTNP